MDDLTGRRVRKGLAPPWAMFEPPGAPNSRCVAPPLTRPSLWTRARSWFHFHNSLMADLQRYVKRMTGAEMQRDAAISLLLEVPVACSELAPRQVTGAVPRALAWFVGWPARRRAARARVRSAVLAALSDLAFGDTESAWTARSIGYRVEYMTEGTIRLHQGNLYPTLRALEADGYLESWDGRPTRERGWFPPRYYRLTARGRAAAAQRPA